jgi:S-DNA-T family DNA segregation ATPase FtsK/SpoIIIE
VRDIWGILLLLVAALAALGMYGDGAGPAGIFLTLLFRGLFGMLGLAAPVVLAAAGLLLLGQPRPGNARLVVGLMLCLVALAGLWHLSTGAPGFSGVSLAALHRSAGWLGAAVALPLRAVAATSGARVLLAAVLALGMMIATATPPRDVVHGLRGLWDWLGERRQRRRLGRAEETATRAADPQPAAAATDGTAAEQTVALRRPGLLEWLGLRSARERAGLLEWFGLGGARGPEGQRAVSDDGVEPGQEPDAGSITAGSAGSGSAVAAEGAEDGEEEKHREDAEEAEEEGISDTRLPPGPPPWREPPEPTQTTRRLGGRAARLRPPADGWEDYVLPPVELLRSGRAAPGNKRALDHMTRALEHTLGQFGVDARVSRVSRGPTVTRFEIELGPGVKVAAVTRLGDDISYALATPEIRIVAPIPGKSAIGIEVPNRDRDLITLGDVLRSPEAEAHHHPLSAGIGVDIGGNAVLVNLATMPHLLIAGATGSGKSVTMNAIVTSVVVRSTPGQVRMVLIDPKRVELNHYEGVPHLLTPVVTDPKRATEALAWTVKEMEGRYERLALLGYRNIDSYNAAVRDGSLRAAPALSGRRDEAWGTLPYILCVIDELSDLMMVSPRDVESAIVRIAQMARAVGIHLIAATQRPSVDVVTGLIKANVPSRIALAMATHADSRTILDQGGAEKLVGHGDMLFLPANASKPHRIQGCYVDESEIEQVVRFCTEQRRADYHPGVVRAGSEAAAADLGDDADDAELVRAAMDLVVRSGLGSTSMLQRKLKVGFARAGRIMDELETMGVVGPSEGSKARVVLMTVDELDQRLDQDRPR